MGHTASVAVGLPEQVDRAAFEQAAGNRFDAEWWEALPKDNDGAVARDVLLERAQTAVKVDIEFRRANGDVVIALGGLPLSTTGAEVKTQLRDALDADGLVPEGIAAVDGSEIAEDQTLGSLPGGLEAARGGTPLAVVILTDPKPPPPQVDPALEKRFLKMKASHEKVNAALVAEFEAIAEADAFSQLRWHFVSDKVPASDKEARGIWEMVVAADGSAVLANRMNEDASKERRFYGKMSEGMKVRVVIEWAKVANDVDCKKHPLCKATAAKVKAKPLKSMPQKLDDGGCMLYHKGGLWLGHEHKGGVFLKAATPIAYGAVIQLFGCSPSLAGYEPGMYWRYSMLPEEAKREWLDRHGA